MKKRFFIVLFFTLVIISNIYSQEVSTTQFMFIADDVSRDIFLEFVNIFQTEDKNKGFVPNNKLPNSLIKEINKQLNEYQPLNNGQVFIGVVNIIHNKDAGGQGYRVYIRITNAKNSEWEYFASMGLL